MLKSIPGARLSHRYRRLGAPLVLAFVLLFAAIPVALASPHSSSLVGPKKYSLALGDSLAFGYQPDLDFNHGYAHDFYENLQMQGTTSQANMGCPNETSITFVNGHCKGAVLRKFPYVGAQLDAAVAYLKLLRGQVSPVTLDIGANDVLPAIDKNTCAVNASAFEADLVMLDDNLTQSILPRLHAALMVNGRLTGDLAVMNYYDPYLVKCPATLSYIELLNQHLANDVYGYGTLVNVFAAFGGPSGANTCAYTWICSAFKDIHPRTVGYSVIASTFENTLGY
ncbi:MAG: hypothetical protein M3Y39_07845 [Chloroflexota bacterium]|nr:hypothetical protein [Chloroflexota bacterium]